MKKILVILLLFLSTTVNAQFFENVYKDYLKYGTVYVAGDVINPQMEVK